MGEQVMYRWMGDGWTQGWMDRWMDDYELCLCEQVMNMLMEADEFMNRWMNSQ